MRTPPTSAPRTSRPFSVLRATTAESMRSKLIWRRGREGVRVAAHVRTSMRADKLTKPQFLCVRTRTLSIGPNGEKICEEESDESERSRVESYEPPFTESSLAGVVLAGIEPIQRALVGAAWTSFVMPPGPGSVGLVTDPGPSGTLSTLP